MQIRVRGQSTYLYTGGKKLTPLTVDREKTVIFIHGAQQDHSCWTLQTRWFAHHGFTVLAPDLPGHGRSAGEPLQSIAARANARAVAGRSTAAAHSSAWRSVAKRTAAGQPDSSGFSSAASSTSWTWT